MIPKYDVIVMDPPWKYGSMQQLNKHVHEHYLTQSMKTMMAWPIQKMCKPTTMLYMWTTGPKMMDAKRLFDAWGFEYKTVAFVWDKERILPGRYSMSQHEYVLVAYNRGQGKTKMPKPINYQQWQLIREKRGAHSAKPETLQDRIELQWGPDVSYCEVFARRFRKGWDCIGNEINGTLEDFLDGKSMPLQAVRSVQTKC